MTPKEKAKELFDKCNKFDFNTIVNSTQKEYARQCALIAVDEIIPIVQSYEDALPPSQTSEEYEYWLQVKKEIENI